MRFARDHLSDALRWSAIGLLAIVYTLAVARPIVLTASDLGRHLTNGRLFLDQGIIQTTNAYSYTHPDFPFLNHHWGSGVLFELARRVAGFTGVSLFGLALIFCTALLYLRMSWRQSSLWMTSVAAVLVLGVFSGRAEVRPELLSYLLSALFLWILLHVREGGSLRWLITLPCLMLVWVNLHIYFFLGIGWIGAFLLDVLVRAWRHPDERAAYLRGAALLGLTLAASCAVTVLNPSGWRGAVYPLLIFQNYAYSVAENQPITKIWSGDYAPAFYVVIAIIALGVSWSGRLYRAYRSGEIPDIALLVLTIFVSCIAWGAIRNFTIFAYVAVVSLPAAWNDYAWPSHTRTWRQTVPFVAIVGTGIVVFLLQPGFWRSSLRDIGIGVPEGTLDSIAFFKENELHGPIFNNYDIGGFLTYGLYPAERVFVDNRPEAYPGTFFTQTLLPMQEDESEWHRVDALFHFNVIFYYRHDSTRRGQTFLLHRVQDPEWAPVFVDDFTIILVRRTPAFADVIQQYEIPQSKFSAKPR